MMTSARGLSLASSIRSMMVITGADARTVSVLVGLVRRELRLHRHAGDADDDGEQLVHFGRIGVRQEEGPDDLILDTALRLAVVSLSDQDGAIVEHLVEHLVGEHQICCRRFFERHAFDVDGDRSVREIAIEDAR